MKLKTKLYFIALIWGGMSLSSCAVIGPSDIDDLRLENFQMYEWSSAISELEKVGPKIRNADLSELMRIDFTTKANLAELAVERGFHVSIEVFACDELGTAGFQLTGMSQVFTENGVSLNSHSGLGNAGSSYHSYLTTRYYKNVGDFSGKFFLEYDIRKEQEGICFKVVGSRFDGAFFESNTVRISQQDLQAALSEGPTTQQQNK